MVLPRPHYVVRIGIQAVIALITTGTLLKEPLEARKFAL